ncbi:MAG: translocation/assembly module TamB domain-containing protein [Duncaniella sp.]|nr:translocation/assembly module TamB domain-containing protein [Duncaniella sp.]
MARRIGKIFLWIILVPVIIILLVPVLLYIPLVQDWAVGLATRKASEATGMDIHVGRLRLTPPLHLSLNDVSVLTSPADTMLTARSASVAVKILPLLRGHVDVEGLELDSAFYQLGTADSVLWLRAHIARAGISATDIILKDNTVNLDRADISGVRIRLRMLEDTTATPVDTTASAPWLINAGRITMTDVDYSMAMTPLIDSLGCHIDRARLDMATVDMRSYRINGRSLSIDSADVSYFYPAISASDTVPAASTSETEDVTTPPWTITADTLRLISRNALYAQTGAVPADGFDPAYIEAKDITVEIDSFYNRGMEIRVPLRTLSATERCGLPLRADGLFAMDSTSMRISQFTVSTLRSTLRADASMGMGDLTADPTLPIALKGNGAIAPEDIALAFPAMKAMLAPMRLTTISTDIEGTASQLNIYSLNLTMPGVMRLAGNGVVDWPFDPDKTGGSVSLDGALASLSDRQFSFLPIATVPALKLNTNIDYHPGEASGDLTVITRGGRLAADGSWSARPEDYDAHITLAQFPVNAFMPELGVGTVTGSLNVDGRGYNPMSRHTSIDADVIVKDVVYLNEHYRDIRLTSSLHAGLATGQISSHNPGADATVGFTATLSGDTVRYDLDGDMHDINLLTLHMSDSICNGHFTLHSAGFYNIATQGMDVTADLSALNWHLPGITIAPTAPITLSASSEATGSRTTLSNGDLNILLTTPGSIMAFASELPAAMNVIQTQIDSMRVDIPVLSAAIPSFALKADMGTSNVASQYLSESGIKLGHISATISNDSLLRFNTLLNSITSGSTRIDTIRLDAVQHGDYLVYNAAMDNRPGTFDDFAHVTFNGFAGNTRASGFIRQSNIKGEKGFNIGLNADLTDSILSIHFVPLKPTIAYKPWKINTDNYLSYDIATGHIDANLELTGDQSFVHIFTDHHEHTSDSLVATTDSIHDGHSVRYHGEQEALKVQISNIHLQDWLSINPFAPPVKGDLSADLSFMYHKPTLTGNGSISLSDLYYGRDRVGDFDLDVNVANSAGGKLMADLTLMVDSIPTITARGVLNDSTLATPFLLDFRMIKFPLSVVNPFIPNKMATLSGMLNGTMQITGDMAAPIFDGYINFDTTAVNVTMLGTSFTFSDEKIPVDSNVVTFKDFNILACNKNPLSINGTVDARHLTDIRLDLDLAARNMQVVNANRASKGSDVYGKAFLDLFAGIKGSLARILNVNADISLLEGTNVTYVMPEAEQTISSQTDQNMVHFVQFNDTTSTQDADSIVTTTMALNLNADLHLREGATVNVDLSANGNNRVHILPSGDLTYTMSPLNGDRLTGRVNIGSGFVRYTPPLMSEKNFEFQEGSYIAFNGDMMNPVLNIQAVDVVRANVTQDGQNSRVVNFDVLLSVTNTFDNMKVSFDLSTNDDITVQNELTSMSAEQRANQAMNLLLYNVYTGANTKGSSMSGNPLFSLLTSQLNTWAANNIRGVDISFGIDQYDRTYEGNTSTTTSYSYRVSKSLFNDRFKIVVGGNYSTDADTDENFSQNLINDISFEYMLNASGSMYVKVFRHTGFESILEGEITQTGVGFVLKRKLNTLWDLFGIRRD